jgi:hypothetical protein
MLDLDELDVEEIAEALADQTDYEHRWLIDPHDGSGGVLAQRHGHRRPEPRRDRGLDLMPIDPLPSHIWYQDMADFAEGISDIAAGRRLKESLQGREAFGRFTNQISEHHPDLLSAWHAFRDARAQRRAVDWLPDQDLIDDRDADQFEFTHRDSKLP